MFVGLILFYGRHFQCINEANNSNDVQISDYVFKILKINNFRSRLICSKTPINVTASGWQCMRIVGGYKRTRMKRRIVPCGFFYLFPTRRIIRTHFCQGVHRTDDIHKTQTHNPTVRT